MRKEFLAFYLVEVVVCVSVYDVIHAHHSFKKEKGTIATSRFYPSLCVCVCVFGWIPTIGWISFGVEHHLINTGGAPRTRSLPLSSRSSSLSAKPTYLQHKTASKTTITTTYSTSTANTFKSHPQQQPQQQLNNNNNILCQAGPTLGV